MAREDWPVKITVRNASAIAANFHRFSREAEVALEDAVTIARGVCVKHIKDNCRKKTGYMRAHTKSKASKNNRILEAGWWREDFIGHLYWDSEDPDKATTITTFYPVPIEEGWHDRAGNFHGGDHILPEALARATPFIIEAVKDGVNAALDRSIGGP